MIPRPLLLICLLICLIAAPRLWAAEPTEEILCEAPLTSSVEPEPLQPTVEEILDDPMKIETLLCHTQPCQVPSDCTRYCQINFGSATPWCDHQCCTCIKLET